MESKGLNQGMEYINGPVLKEMISAGANRLDYHKKLVDELNVFPVPDGDTGTNMSLTIFAAVKEMEKVRSDSLHAVAGALSSGSLMGARGNSGVILSQIFRGFTKSIGGKKQIGSQEFSLALQEGANTAYRAVMKPVEGTILTVAREIAKAAENASKETKSIEVILEKALEKGRLTLEKTPEMLPVLKQAGVVDAGGKGLIYILEGMASTVMEQEIPAVLEEDRVDVVHEVIDDEESLKKELIYPYCTELLLYSSNGQLLSETKIRKELDRLGDSMLVVGSSDMIKIHIHTNKPGEVLLHCGKMGEMRDIKIDNMNYQHRTSIVEEEQDLPSKEEEGISEDAAGDGQIKKEYGLVAVAAGEGLAEVFKSLGVDEVVTGGQTMNPSTEELASAARNISSEKVVILPNNSNIILAAEQVKDILDRPVFVIPTSSIPEGIAALLVFDPAGEPEKNQENMLAAFQNTKTGEVTYAVRDSAFNGIELQEGDILGISNREIVVSGKDPGQVVLDLLGTIVKEEDSLITLYYGEDIEEEAADQLQEKVEQSYPEVDVEVYQGGQPLYYYFISVE